MICFFFQIILRLEKQKISLSDAKHLTMMMENTSRIFFSKIAKTPFPTLRPIYTNLDRNILLLYYHYPTSNLLQTGNFKKCSIKAMEKNVFPPYPANKKINIITF